MVDSLIAFEKIYQDIVIDRPDRILKSVIVMSAGFTREGTDSDEKEWKRYGDAWDDALSPLLKKGIPIVLASGNKRELSDDMHGLPETRTIRRAVDSLRFLRWESTYNWLTKMEKLLRRAVHLLVSLSAFIVRFSRSSRMRWKTS
jgi:hypothetical protein